VVFSIQYRPYPHRDSGGSLPPGCGFSPWPSLPGLSIYSAHCRRVARV